VYTEDVDALRRQALHLLDSSPYSHLVLLGCSAKKYDLPLYSGSVSKLVAMFRDEIVGHEGAPNLVEIDHHSIEVKKFCQDSILVQMTQLLYRIKDKSERSSVSTSVYRYVSGASRLPVTSIPKLNDLLKSEVAARYRSAGKLVRSGMNFDTACKHFKIDRFDLSYCIRKSGASEELISRASIKEYS